MVEVGRVVGVISGASKPVMEYGYGLTGDEEETDLLLESVALERIADFYEQTRAREPGTTGFYNCHIFVNYVLGKTLEIPEGRCWWQGWRAAPAVADSLEPGEAYGIINRFGFSAHSLLGIEQPQMNLGILGNRLPLALSRTEDLFAPYDGTKIVRYI